MCMRSWTGLAQTREVEAMRSEGAILLAQIARVIPAVRIVERSQPLELGVHHDSEVNLVQFRKDFDERLHGPVVE